VASARDIRAGAAYIELYTKDSALVRGLARAQRKLKAFGASARRMGMGLAKLSAVLATPLVAGVKSFTDFEREMANVSTMLDRTVHSNYSRFAGRGSRPRGSRRSVLWAAHGPGSRVL